MSKLPSLSTEKLFKILESFGFEKIRKGDVYFFKHPDNRVASVSVHPCEDEISEFLNKIIEDEKEKYLENEIEKRLEKLEEIEERKRKIKRKREREFAWKQKGIRIMNMFECTPCENLNECCNKNVHKIIGKMGQGKLKNGYIGDLFRGKYPVFDDVDKCVQYLQEYVPLHLLQIQYVLEKVIIEFRDFSKTINVLDIGSGPATVPLAFCRILNSKDFNYKLKITTVEPSIGFIKMIDIFNKENSMDFIESINNSGHSLDDFMKDEKLFNFSYDWIIIANSISALGKNWEDTWDREILEDRKIEVEERIYNLVSNILQHNKNEKILLTIIENNATKKFFPIDDYLEEMEELSLTDLKITPIYKINLKLFRPKLMNCKFYKTGKDHETGERKKLDRPKVISKSFWFTLKK